MARIVKISNRDKTASPKSKRSTTNTNLSNPRRGSVPPGVQNAVKVRGGSR